MTGISTVNFNDPSSEIIKERRVKDRRVRIAPHPHPQLTPRQPFDMSGLTYPRVSVIKTFGTIEPVL